MIYYPDTKSIANIVHGAWIDDRATIHLLENRLEHSRFCDYGDAHKCGWIGVVMFKPDPRGPEYQRIGFRLNPRTATVAALLSAICVTEQFPEATYLIEDSWTGRLPRPEGHERKSEYKAKQAAKYFNELRWWKTEMSPSLEKDFPSPYPKEEK